MSPEQVASSSADQPQPAEQAPKRPSGRRPFHPRRDQVELPTDAAARQGRATMLAWEILGDSGATRIFLNTFDAALQSRPIELAIGSADGLAAVEAALTNIRRCPS